MIYDFFIAHSGADTALAQDFFQELTARNLSCFLDVESLSPGDNWDTRVPEAVKASASTLVLVSATTQGAFYEREEVALAISLARSSDHRVIPISVGDNYPDEVPYGLRVKHGLVLGGGSTFASLCDRIAETAGFENRGVLQRSEDESLPVIISYNIDIVVCIDVSASVTWLNLLARRHLLTLGSDLAETMRIKRKEVTRLRVGLIRFGPDSTDLRRSPLIELPLGAALLHREAQALGSGVAGFSQSRGLDALDLALQTDWCIGERTRHIVALFTDRPAALTVDLDSLTDRWESDLDFASKRLVLYAPDAQPWVAISSAWSLCIHYLVDEAGGLDDVSYVQILDALANSV